MSYTTIHEIHYRSESGRSLKIAPGSVLTQEQERALSSELEGLVGLKALKKDESDKPAQEDFLRTGPSRGRPKKTDDLDNDGFDVK